MGRVLTVLLLTSTSISAVCAQTVKDETIELNCADWTKVGDHEWKRTGTLVQRNVTLHLNEPVLKDTAETKILDLKCLK